MKYYQYDTLGVFTGKTIDLDIKDPIPPFYTQKEIPSFEEDESPLFKGGNWLVIKTTDLPISVEKNVDPWIEIREKRDALLRESDTESFITLLDVWESKTAEEQNAWLEYRKALRDIPSTYENVDDVVWPEKP